LLNEIIDASDYPINVIARKSGMSVQSLHNKRTGIRKFTVEEILALCKTLKITKKQRLKIFSI
jgi:hypothetical protein